jgi:hypothetical protein
MISLQEINSQRPRMLCFIDRYAQANTRPNIYQEKKAIIRFLQSVIDKNMGIPFFCNIYMGEECLAMILKTKNAIYKTLFHTLSFPD